MEFEQLIKLIQTVSESELTGFKYEEGSMKLSMNKEKAKSAAAATGMPAAEFGIPAVPEGMDQAGENLPAGLQNSEESKPGRLVRSPLVGTFYTAPTEDAEPFVAEGAAVKKGQTIAIVEAMKLMNDIESEFDGTVAEVLVSNGEAVEYGQPLFRIV